MAAPPLRSVAELLEVLSAGASTPTDEVVDQLTHALQCAELLAAEHPGDAELAVAGLVHDIAHVTDPGGTEHDAEGARLVRGLLGERVAGIVAGHVVAKRWLVAHDPGYVGELSAASVASLEFQGGPAGEHELAGLERRPHFASAVELRRADDRAKDPAARVAGLDRWRPVLETVAEDAARRARG